MERFANANSERLRVLLIERLAEKRARRQAADSQNNAKNARRASHNLMLTQQARPFFALSHVTQQFVYLGSWKSSRVMLKQ